MVFILLIVVTKKNFDNINYSYSELIIMLFTNPTQISPSKPKQLNTVYSNSRLKNNISMRQSTLSSRINSYPSRSIESINNIPKLIPIGERFRRPNQLTLKKSSGLKTTSSIKPNIPNASVSDHVLDTRGFNFRNEHNMFMRSTVISPTKNSITNHDRLASPNNMTTHFLENNQDSFGCLPYTSAGLRASLNFHDNVVIVPAPSVTNPKPELEVERLYVINRRLEGYPKINKLCHSGLLLKTKTNNWYILEYGVGSGQNRNNVYLYQISSYSENILKNDSKITKFACKDRTCKTRLWFKQRLGQSFDSVQTTESLEDIMNRIVRKKSYNVLTWNCHMAQENTRRSLGLKVDNSYKSPSITIGINNNVEL